jgi:hypothetical protein
MRPLVEILRDARVFFTNPFDYLRFRHGSAIPRSAQERNVNLNNHLFSAPSLECRRLVERWRLFG